MQKPKVEKVVDGYTGFLFLDDKGLPLVAMHWEHRFNHMVKRYNDIYRVDAECHVACLPAHVLQQYGEIRHESKNAAVSYGT